MLSHMDLIQKREDRRLDLFCDSFLFDIIGLYSILSYHNYGAGV